MTRTDPIADVTDPATAATTDVSDPATAATTSTDGAAPRVAGRHRAGRLPAGRHRAARARRGAVDPSTQEPPAGRGGERGSASLELVGVSLVLLVPMFYLVMTLSRLQAGSYAVSGAARDAARVFVASRDVGEAQARARAAAGIVYGDYGLRGGDVQVACLDDPCLGPDARVRATATVRVPLPLVPGFVRAVVPTEVTVHADQLETVDRFRGQP